jgi:centromere protein C
VQEEITANEDSVVINGVAEGTSIAHIGDDTVNGAEDVEDLVDMEESEVTQEPVKEPTRRGRKRKSDALEEEDTTAPRPRKRGPTSAAAAETQKKGKKAATVPAATSRRSKLVSDIAEQESSALDVSADVSTELVEVSEVAPAPKRRGRPPRAKADAEKGQEKESPVPSKATKSAAPKAKASSEFKKPSKPAPKVKEKPVGKSKSDPQTLAIINDNSGKLVDACGRPRSKKDVEQMSTMSMGSRHGRDGTFQCTVSLTQRLWLGSGVLADIALHPSTFGGMIALPTMLMVT